MVYNHTAEGGQAGPTSVLPRARRPRLLQAATPATDGDALLGRHRLRQHRRRRRPARAAADPGLAALLGRPRCTSTASASTSPRRWPAPGTTSTCTAPFLTTIGQDPVLRHVKLIAEPWDASVRRLPGRRVPAPVDGVERPLPRHPPRLLARRDPAACATSPPGWPGPATCTPTTAARRTPRSTSSPPTTGSPCATWSPTTASTTRPTARTTGTAPTTTGRGTAASRARPTTPASAALRRRQAANLMVTLLPVERGADAHRRRRARPHPAAATTTPTARTTRSPGSTGAPTTRGSTSTTVTRTALRLRREHPALRQRHHFVDARPCRAAPRTSPGCTPPAGR